jgi:hypothetical protein
MCESCHVPIAPYNLSTKKKHRFHGTLLCIRQVPVSKLVLQTYPDLDLLLLNSAPSRKMLGHYLKISHDFFISYNFQCVIHTISPDAAA